MKTLLVSLDLKHDHQPLLDQAITLAKAYSAEVLLVTVADEDEAVRSRMELLLAELTDEGVITNMELLQGKPGEQVVAKGNEIDADMIIIGHHGNSSVFDTLAGSAGQDIMQHAGRPVLLVPVPKDSDS